MRKLLLCSLLLVLAACTETIVPPKDNGIKLSGDIFALNVAHMRVIQDYVSPRTTPNVEHLFAFAPADAVKTWVKTRLSANGNTNSMEIVINDASVIRKELPKQKQGVEGMFTKEQAEEFDGTLNVSLNIYNDIKPLPVAIVNATVHRSLTLPEGATQYDHEQLYHQITKDLIDGLNLELEKNIHQYFSQYLL